jgi:peptide/nickel transport system substrate-binding protein
MRTRYLLIVVAFLVATFLFPFRSSFGSSDQLRVAIDKDMIEIDPATIRTTTDRLLGISIFNGLLTYKPGTSEIEKDLAESYEVSPDGKMITFKLRKGVKFHKGYGELVSSDVKFSIMRHLDPKVKSRDLVNFSIVERVETPDKYTAKVFLKNPSMGFLGLIAYHSGFILSEKAASELGSKHGTQPIGTGPFQFDSRVPGSEITLTSHSDYFEGPSKIKKLILKVIPDPSVSINAVQKGEIDFYSIENIGAFRSMQRIKDKNFRIFTTDKGSLSIYLHYLNCRSGSCKDFKVRQAVAHAIDADAIVKSFGGLVNPNPSLFAPPFPNYTDKLPTYKYDVNRAKQLLKEAGYDEKTKFAVTYVDYGLNEAYAIMVKDYLTKIMDVELIKWDISVFMEKLREGKWDLYVMCLTRPTENIFCNQFYHSKAPGNFPGYENPELNRLIEEADIEQNAVKRKAFYAKVQEIMAINLPYLAAGVHNNTEIMHKTLEGIIPEAHTGVAKFYKAYFKE